MKNQPRVKKRHLSSLPTNWHGWTCTTLVSAGTQFTNPRGMEGSVTMSITSTRDWPGDDILCSSPPQTVLA